MADALVPKMLEVSFDPFLYEASSGDVAQRGAKWCCTNVVVTVGGGRTGPEDAGRAEEAVGT